jgi:hypothetical protein
VSSDFTARESYHHAVRRIALAVLVVGCGKEAQAPPPRPSVVNPTPAVDAAPAPPKPYPPEWGDDCEPDPDYETIGDDVVQLVRCEVPHAGSHDPNIHHPEYDVYLFLDSSAKPAVSFGRYVEGEYAQHYRMVGVLVANGRSIALVGHDDDLLGYVVADARAWKLVYFGTVKWLDSRIAGDTITFLDDNSTLRWDGTALR